MNLISLLVWLIILCLIFSVVWWILGQMPIPTPFRMVVNVVFGLVVLLILLSLLFGGVALPVLRLG